MQSMNPTWKYGGARDKIIAQVSEGFSFSIDIRRGADTWYITKAGNPLVAEVVVKQGDVTIYEQTFVNMPLSRELRRKEPYRTWIVSDSTVNYVLKYHYEQVSEMLRAIENVQDAKDSQKHGRTEIPQLSERERRVLSCILEGLTNKQIADRLDVSESSVKATLQQLFDKAGVRTRSKLIRVALEQYRNQL